MYYRITTLHARVLLLCTVAAFAFPASSRAQTVGYWRFESGAFLDDSSGNGHNLTTNTGPATQVAIPANFPTQVPPTSGPTNAMAANLPGSGLLAAPDDDAWTSSAFTVEAFIKPDAVSAATSVLVGNFDSTTGSNLDRGWFMGINNGNLRLLVQGGNAEGTGWGFIKDRFKAITAGNEYYVACSFATGPGGVNSIGTLYLQDLTAGGPMRTSTYWLDTATGWEVPNNSTSPLSIGSTGAGTSNYDGIIDEVRFSHGTLAVEDLLAYHPGITFQHDAYVKVEIADPASDGTITSVAIASDPNTITTYAPGDLVGATMTDFGGSIDEDAEFIMPIGSTDAPTPTERAGVLGDGRADTGLINMMSWAVTFEQDIVNRPGPDLVVLDWGGTGDTVDITIGGMTLDDVATLHSSAVSAQNGRPRFLSDQWPVTSLSALEAATFSFNTTTGASSSVLTIDLSDFGYADGAPLLSGTEVAFSDGGEFDPMEIFGLLEPSGTPGDFDNDGDVDIADLMEWQRGYGSTYNDTDLADWKTAFAGSASSGIAVVPEPTAPVLLLSGLVALLTRARRS